MAWFLGLIGFFFMLSTLLAPDWLTHTGTGPLPSFSVGGVNPVQTSWGLYEGCALTQSKDDEGNLVEDWICSPVVSLREDPKTEREFNDLVGENFSWLATVGSLVIFGEVFLAIALIIVFIGLCCPFGWRFRCFRSGMYLYLLADLLFMIGLIIYLAQLTLMKPERALSHSVGWCVGMGWGVVIIVFTGALLLLLDKEPPKKSVPEDADIHA